MPSVTLGLSRHGRCPSTSPKVKTGKFRPVAKAAAILTENEIPKFTMIVGV